MIQIRRSSAQLLLPVHVTPRGGRDCLLSFKEGDTALKVKVTSPPEDGKANAAVIQLLANLLRIPKSRIHVHRGDTSRHKQIGITLQDQADEETLLRMLEQLLNASCLEVL